MMLSEEVFKRVRVRWPIVNSSTSDRGGYIITLTTNSSAEVDWSSPEVAEGYELSVGAGGVRVTGADQRGLLYGVGRLIRLIHLTLTENYFHARQTTLTVRNPLSIRSIPDRPMRGIQFGYHPKTNSYYDGDLRAVHRRRHDVRAQPGGAHPTHALLMTALTPTTLGSLTRR